MMVDAVEGPDGSEATEMTAAPPTIPDAPSAPPPVAAPATAPAPAVSPEQVQQIVDSLRALFSRATQPPRWPMYVRQLKQFIRGMDPAFDERKWGFATIMEFLRVCQREGLFRLERDRRGQIRVFPGSALQAASAAAPARALHVPETEEIRDVVESEPIEAMAPDAIDVDQQIAAEAPVAEVVEIDDQPFDAGQETPFESSQGNASEPNHRRPSRVKTRRTRKPSTAGKPAARKSTGARAPARRRKTPVTAA
jgi:hypothetical protein